MEKTWGEVLITFTMLLVHTKSCKGPSWWWSYGSWIYNYLCNQCLSPLIVSLSPVHDEVYSITTLCDKACQ